MNGNYFMVGKCDYRPKKVSAHSVMFTVLLAIMAIALLSMGSAAWAQDSSGNNSAKKAAAKEAAAKARARTKVFSTLEAQVRQLKEKEAAIAAQRIRAQRHKLAVQQNLVQKAVARRNKAKARSDALNEIWKKRDARINKLSTLLTQHEGDLGEVFGVTREVAANAGKVFRQSLLSTQLEPPAGQQPRSKFMLKLAQAQSLPDIHALRRLWYELLRGMVATGKVVRYKTGVLQLGQTANAVPTQVVRVGAFTVTHNDTYLGYLSSVKELTQLKGSLPSSFRATAANLANATAATATGYVPAVVDPSGGAIIGLYLSRPTWLDRVQLGQTEGYIIIAVGVIGVLLALLQFTYLFRTRRAVRIQEKNPSNPTPDNPLGRVLLTFSGDKGKPANAEVAELQLSEAVLHEIPTLERFQGVIKLGAAAGPLLGLIGTVTGMIITFHAIVASGGNDPTLMAKGIGHAMIATVLGLSVAIPLLFIHAGLVAVSSKIVDTLDEFSQSLLARQVGQDKKSSAR